MNIFKAMTGYDSLSPSAARRCITCSETLQWALTTAALLTSMISVALRGCWRLRVQMHILGFSYTLIMSIFLLLR